jgi:BirA family biotin operon repressor/biotin-[acetyl-CoA-carboxylase] ligase
MTIMVAPIRWFDELDSTNAEAARLAQAGEAGPVWIAARRQSAGRGRRGRVWETGQGDLAATLLMTLDMPPGEAAQLSFVTALAAGDLIRAYAPAAAVAYKWPNDVLIGGQKACGVLIESGPRAGQGMWLAVGVGLNLTSAPEGTEFPATCLAAHIVGPPPGPEQALGRLATAMAERISAWRQDGFAPVRTAWLQAAYGLGDPCTARLGRETVQGVAEGLDIDGALVLRLDDGSPRRITAGDIFFGEP